MTNYLVRHQREVPAHLQELLARAGGSNRYGEPNFRIVWSGSRLELMGGEWLQPDDHSTIVGYRWFPKYHYLADRFIIEKWCPPEFYGPEWQWEIQTTAVFHGQRILQLGPFPSRGEYELSWVCQEPVYQEVKDIPQLIGYRYLEPTTGIIEAYVRRMLYQEKFSNWERLQAIKREAEAAEAEVRRVNRDDLSDVSPFNKGSYVTVPREV